MTEKDIKIKLVKYLFKKDIHDIIIPEVTVGHKSNNNKQVRADLFTINRDISIYEIKSEKDSLQRLSNQIENYKEYANKITIVVAEKFLPKLDIDDYIGIYSINEKGIKEIRKAKSLNISSNNLLEYWLSNELKDFLKGYSGISKLDKEQLKSYLKNLLNEVQIYNATLYMLKQRYSKESTIIKNQINNNTLIDFPKRGLLLNNNTISLKNIPFGYLMP